MHEGQEWIYVLSGRLRLVLGERDFTISPGEAVEFSTWTPHRSAHHDPRKADHTMTDIGADRQEASDGCYCGWVVR